MVLRAAAGSDRNMVLVFVKKENERTAFEHRATAWSTDSTIRDERATESSCREHCWFSMNDSTREA